MRFALPWRLWRAARATPPAMRPARPAARLVARSDAAPAASPTAVLRTSATTDMADTTMPMPYTMAPAAQPRAAAPPAAVAAGDASVRSPADPRGADRRFTALLLSGGTLRDGEPDAAQREALQRLEAMARTPPERGLVPRMPALLPRLLGLVRRDDVSARELAEPLSRDPALLGEVIRLANSPRYRGPRPIASVQEALLLLGQRGLEQLLVRLVMGPVFDGRGDRFGRAAATALWEQAERCAHACGWLRRAAHDGFEAYLAGMVANAGLMVGLRVLDRHLPDGARPDTRAFHDALTDASARLTVVVARQWNFPPAVVAALEARLLAPASDDPLAPDDLAGTLRTAERLSKLHVLAAHGEARDDALTEPERHCRRELQRVFGG